MSKYHVKKLNSGWAVVMTASNRIMEVHLDEAAADRSKAEFENGLRVSADRPEVWLVGDSFVCEPYVGGQMYGESSSLDMMQYNVVKKITQKRFDTLVLKAMEDGDF